MVLQRLLLVQDRGDHAVPDLHVHVVVNQIAVIAAQNRGEALKAAGQRHRNVVALDRARPGRVEQRHGKVLALALVQHGLRQMVRDHKLALAGKARLALQVQHGIVSRALAREGVARDGDVFSLRADGNGKALRSVGKGNLGSEHHVAGSVLRHRAVGVQRLDGRIRRPDRCAQRPKRACCQRKHPQRAPKPPRKAPLRPIIHVHPVRLLSVRLNCGLLTLPSSYHKQPKKATQSRRKYAVCRLKQAKGAPVRPTKARLCAQDPCFASPERVQRTKIRFWRKKPEKTLDKSFHTL